MRNLSWLLISASLIATTSAFADTSPWAQRKLDLDATIGANRCVRIADPVQTEVGTPGKWTIAVTACSPDMASALAFVLKTELGTSGAVEVSTPDGTKVEAPAIPDENRVAFVFSQYEAAFAGNPYFSRVLTQGPTEWSVARVNVKFKLGLVKVSIESGEQIEVTAPMAFGEVTKKIFAGLPPKGVTAEFTYEGQ